MFFHSANLSSSRVVTYVLAWLFLVFGGAAIGATFPDAPSIVSPEDGAISVATAPTIQATPLVGLQEAEWLIYQPDETVQFLGGLQDSNSSTFATVVAGEFQEIDTPVVIEIDGRSVAKLRIYPSGKLEALDGSGEVLGRVTAQIDSGSYLPSAVMPYTLVKTYSGAVDAVRVRWTFIHDTHGEVTLDALFKEDGYAALQVSPSTLTEELYTLTGGAVGCGLEVDNTLYETNMSLADWKAVFDNNDFADFSLLCGPGAGAITLSTLLDPALPALTLPAIQTFTSNADTLTVTSQADELESGMQYQVQVRYETTAGNFSNWSDPVSFTTDIDTDYLVDLSGNADFNFVAGEPRSLSVSISNEGTDAGLPRIQVRLPFDVLDGLNGSVSDFYAISGCDSSFAINGGVSTFSCDLSELAAGNSVAVNATLALPEGVDTIEYRVCEQSLCDEAPYESLSVSVVAGEPPSDPGSSSSSSSSGGAFGYLLLALLVLGGFRRR